MIRPDIGKVAPAFTTTDENGNKVALKDYRGQIVVLYFYPKAMTPGCTVQACGLRDSKKELDKLNVVTLGISPDPSPRLLKFKERDELNFTLLSDEDQIKKMPKIEIEKEAKRDLANENTLIKGFYHAKLFL